MSFIVHKTKHMFWNMDKPISTEAVRLGRLQKLLGMTSECLQTARLVLCLLPIKPFWEKKIKLVVVRGVAYNLFRHFCFGCAVN